jgi:hypothetical protein
LTSGGLAGLLNHLRSRLDAEGVPFVIGGAFALAARGHPRFTDDIDVMVLTRDLAPVHRAFAGHRLSMVNEVTFRDDETGLLVDVIPVEDEAQRRVFEDATPTEVEGAKPARVLTAEGLAVMLLREATHGDPARRPLRLRDVELLATSGTLDWGYVVAWTRRMGYEDAYRELRAPGKPNL